MEGRGGEGKGRSICLPPRFDNPGYLRAWDGMWVGAREGREGREWRREGGEGGPGWRPLVKS